MSWKYNYVNECERDISDQSVRENFVFVIYRCFFWHESVIKKEKEKPMRAKEEEKNGH